MFTGGAADYVADIKALEELGVSAVDVRLFAHHGDAHGRQHAPLPRRSDGEGSIGRRARDAAWHHDADQSAPTPKLSMDEVLEAERLGYVSVWSGEAWGTDAVSPVAWVLARTTKIKAGTAIMQMQARTPSCAAMTAMTLNALSGGRFLLRRRSVRAAGDRGLARRGLRQAARPHQGIHRDHPQGAGARGAADLPGRALPDSLRRARCHRSRQAAAQHRARRSRHADLHRVDHAGRPAHRGRGVGWHAADLVLAGAGGSGGAADPRRPREGGEAARLWMASIWRRM